MKDRLLAVNETFSENIVPHITFPENPTTSIIDGIEVYDYLSVDQATAAIDLISSYINFENFDAVLVNLEGASYLYDRLSEKAGYRGEIVEIEYHGHGDNFRIDKPVPEKLFGKKCLVIDDVYDTGHTLNGILKDLSPDSVCVTLVSKLIDNKEVVSNIIYGVKVDNKWLAGCGMDLKNEHDGPFRVLPRIVVMKSN